MGTRPTYEELSARVAKLERQLAERRARDDLYRAVFTHMLHEVHVWQVVRDEAGEIQTWRLVDANPAALRAWSCELAEVAGKTADEIFPDGTPTSQFMPVVRQLYREGSPHVWEEDFPGTNQVLHMVSVPIGERFFSTGVDVTEAKLREQRLSDALLRMQQLIRASRVGLWDWDLTTDEVRYSPEWKSQIGYADHEIGNDFEEWRSRMHPDDLEQTLARVQERVRAAGQDYEVTFRFRHKDGSYRWILANGSVVVDDDGTPVRMLGSHVDITARKKLEDQVLQQQRLEAVGTLAGGIAHDFNNLLAAAAMSLASARDRVPAESDVQEMLQDTEQAVWQASSLTHELLTFSTGGEPMKAVVSVSVLLEDASRLMTYGTNTECEVRVESGLRDVEVDAGQVSQVFNNLILNAQQAMLDGGTVRIHAQNATLPADDPTGLPAGDYVVVSVADRGVGIPPEHQSKIFDPFFTTKETGSGLGLAAAHGIVTRHGGRLAVESEPGRGTVFHVTLPAAAREASPEPAEPASIHGTGRLLVMDDQPLVRSTMQTMLTELGYTVDVAASGSEAVATFGAAHRADTPYDLAILDLTIVGEIGATDTILRLREIDPDVHAIVMSGYTEGPVLANHREYGFVGRLRKPCRAQQVSLEVDRVLRLRGHRVRTH